MSLTVITHNPKDLLAELKNKIDSKSIITWIYDKDGDFTHSPEQWKYKAWLKPQIINNELQFGFIGNKEENTTKLVYAVYHGRFAEMLLNHFDDKITTISASAMPTMIDKITRRKK